MLAVDIEAFDPSMNGAIKGDGLLLCVGLYDGKDYVNCTPNDPRLKDWLASDEDKIFHNGVYDLPWLLFNLGYEVGGVWHDTMTRSALIDEYTDLDLDSCCKTFKVQGKNFEDTLESWWKENQRIFGLRGNIWKHLDFVWSLTEGRERIIKYNKQDCIATYNLFHAQEYIIRVEELTNVYKMECDLYPVIMEMKRNGIRIDAVERDRFTADIESKLKDVVQRLKFNYEIDNTIIASPKKLGVAMNKLGIYSPVATLTGAQSWAADVLDLIDHPAVALIQETKNYNALLSKYLYKSFRTDVINGRIYSTFSPNKRDEGGTITGRLASREPNMQNIPAREDKHGQKSYGQEMRNMFIPDDGCLLGAFDYSQIEYLLLAHYARGSQAEWFRAQANAGVDFHTVAQDITGIKSRDVIKRMNYGFIYGMGLNRLMQINRLLFKQLAAAANMDIAAFGKQLYEQYHSRLPVIKDTMNWAQAVTKQAGSIRSIGGRIHHKPRPVFDNGKMNDGLYKMTNYLIQGSAAEILKRGLIDAWQAGVFKVLHLHITVHDENVVSIPYNKEGTEAGVELQRLMENAYREQLSVPMKVVGEVGPTWGYWKGDIWKDMQANVFNLELAKRL
jgi:DNA polymerase-1